MDAAVRRPALHRYRQHRHRPIEFRHCLCGNRRREFLRRQLLWRRHPQVHRRRQELDAVLRPVLRTARQGRLLWRRSPHRRDRNRSRQRPSAAGGRGAVWQGRHPPLLRRGADLGARTSRQSRHRGAVRSGRRQHGLRRHRQHLRRRRHRRVQIDGRRPELVSGQRKRRGLPSPGRCGKNRARDGAAGEGQTCRRVRRPDPPAIC